MITAPRTPIRTRPEAGPASPSRSTDPSWPHGNDARPRRRRRLKTLVKAASVTVRVDADAAAVWAVAGDPTRVGEWSGECHRVTWLGGATEAALGARFVGHSTLGRLRWKRTAEVVALEPGRRIAWKNLRSPMHPDSTRWELLVEPDGEGTRITSSYTVSIGPIGDRLAAHFAPSHVDRRAEIAGDLLRLGEAAAAAGADGR